VRGFLRDFFTGIGDPAPSARHLRTAAWVRLLLAVPVVLVPTGIGLHALLPEAAHPESARLALQGWVAACVGVVVANVGILALRPTRSALRARIAYGLTALSLVFELTTNQLSAHAIGTLTSYGMVYVVVIVAIYRVFFDYRLGLLAVVAGLCAFVASVVLGHLGVVESAPLLPSVQHVVYEDARAAGLVVQSMIAAVLLTFFSVNFAVNQALKLHRYITESVLRRYLPESLVARAARGELTLDAEPERRVVTVMFTDIVGFTSLAERLGADQVARLLNRYLSEMADLAHAHGATVDKFVGDAVMIVFGAPDDLPPETQARRCVGLALAMQGRIAGDESTGLQIRAGINSGEAVVGHFGSGVRSDYTVIGHAVNVAARLETASRAGGVLVSAETARLLGGAWPLEPAGALTLKNVSEPLEAFYVMEAQAEVDASTAPAAVEEAG
jgi:class 3 adenylate cyclase